MRVSSLVNVRGALTPGKAQSFIGLTIFLYRSFISCAVKNRMKCGF